MKRIISVVMLISVVFGMFTYAWAKDGLPMVTRTTTMVYDYKGIELGTISARTEILAVDTVMGSAINFDDRSVFVMFILKKGGWFSDPVYGFVNGFHVVKK